MSANNHDNQDPNNVKYIKPIRLSPRDENMGRMIKIYQMTLSLSFSKWVEWMNEQGYIINISKN